MALSANLPLDLILVWINEEMKKKKILVRYLDAYFWTGKKGIGKEEKKVRKKARERERENGK